MRRNPIGIAGLALALLGSSLACGDETLVRARPPFTVVDGTPAVDTGLPSVEDSQPTVDPDAFANNAPVQVDVFFQKTVRKVDILWIVDNSGSMQEEQASLASNFGAFIEDLAQADPPVDYHLGIITTDATAEKGALRALATDGSKRYIACNENGHTGCNVSDPEAAFRQTIAVGTGGGAIEKGLLAAHLALVDPMRSTTNAGFLRDDAALYAIFVSDEGDASCNPLVSEPAGSDLTSCNFSPYCRCGDEASLTYGAIDYYVRFFKGLKGYGNAGLVSTAAIVATSQDTFSLGSYTFSGCNGSGGTAFYAPRYVELAQQTGGITTSICESDFSSALSKLGFAVSGQRTEFSLSRRPVRPDLVPLAVYLQTDLADPASKQEVPNSATDGWTYVECENGQFVNAIRFAGTWVPPPSSRIEVTYQVNVGAGRTCN